MNGKNGKTELYDSGCISLIEAIVRQAASDYIRAERSRKSRLRESRLRETAGFFRSDYFRRLTGLDGEHLLKRIRKEGERK